MLTILIGVTVGALDRPVRVGERRMTWTETLLRAIDGAKTLGYRTRMLDTLRSALEVGANRLRRRLMAARASSSSYAKLPDGATRLTIVQSEQRGRGVHALLSWHPPTEDVDP